MLNGFPTVIPAKVTSVRLSTAFALPTKAAAARTRFVNCILVDSKELGLEKKSRISLPNLVILISSTRLDAPRLSLGNLPQGFDGFEIVDSCGERIEGSIVWFMYKFRRTDGVFVSEIEMP